MSDMQSPKARSDEEGLHERKPTHQGNDSPQQGDSQDENDIPDAPKKEKKTFGRTPDGVGKNTFLSGFSQRHIVCFPQRPSRRHMPAKVVLVTSKYTSVNPLYLTLALTHII